MYLLLLILKLVLTACMFPTIVMIIFLLEKIFVTHREKLEHDRTNL